jgi:hypothetical protein
MRVVMNGWPATSDRTERSWLTWSTCLSLMTRPGVSVAYERKCARLTFDLPEDLQRKDLVPLLLGGICQPGQPYSGKSTYGENTISSRATIPQDRMHSPVPSVLISSKSFTLSARELPPNSLFRAPPATSSGGKTCFCSVKRAMKSLSCWSCVVAVCAPLCAMAEFSIGVAGCFAMAAAAICLGQ